MLEIDGNDYLKRMARAIVRTSINGSTPNSQKARLGKLLVKHGFTKIGTGAYEGYGDTADDVMETVATVVAHLASLAEGFSVDQLWWYHDQATPPAGT
ncbi:hypothetical protein HNR19_003142 [Nocardioides thalensis]|uniref:Uncharacterized protein n=1 Tax=Nocardioides thalensis TaxID=1914755 RepID=A0A853C4Q8_9ACTN|nr:hypothetical protein [Nocardioides thalensis]NYJ02444.1 hypothetical protein [Nocardioides thalensis]